MAGSTSLRVEMNSQASWLASTRRKMVDLPCETDHWRQFFRVRIQTSRKTTRLLRVLSSPCGFFPRNAGDLFHLTATSTAVKAEDGIDERYLMSDEVGPIV